MSLELDNNISFPDKILDPPDCKLIRKQLRKIIASSEFHASKQQRAFLDFVIAETLAGRKEDLKGYTIATQVFGRGAEFDTSTDPIVSIQANKLRRALERYYLVEGRLDPIRIDIPKGTYIPQFIRQDTSDNCSASNTEQAAPLTDNPWPTILILPFKNLTGDPDQNFLGSGISTELAIEISRFGNMRVFYPREGLSHSGASPCAPARFLLNGELYKEEDGIKLALYLVDTTSGLQIWGSTSKTELSISELSEFKEKVVQGVATKICGEFGIIPKLISKETRHKLPQTLSTYEAILRFWEYEHNNNPETFSRAFEALKAAVVKEPENGLLLGSLSILYGTIHNLGIPGFENPLDQAVLYAEKAAMINPYNQRVLAILALARLSSNELPAAIFEAHQALDLNPDSLFVLDGLAWILTLAGDWEHGPRLAEKAIRLNPFHRAIAHDALWLNYLRQEHYDLAYREACSLHYSKIFWTPLIKASTLGLVGREKEGVKFAQKLLELRPDFLENGRRLIRNYIKFEELVTRTEEGLRMVGLKLT